MIKKVFSKWFLIALVAGIFSLVVYATVQQDLRQSANDPQIQMAEDNISPQSLPTIDISKSLAPFIIVFDENGNPISSSATLNGTTPVPPVGIFQNVRMSGEERLTWQPEVGVRIATIVDKTSAGFILAGRNIREVEARESHTLLVVIAGYIMTLVFSFFLLIIYDWLGV